MVRFFVLFNNMKKHFTKLLILQFLKLMASEYRH